MISETRFLSGGYSTFITISNRWNIWADDNFVSQICLVCETNFCSWRRLIVFSLVGGRVTISPSPPAFFLGICSLLWTQESGSRWHSSWEHRGENSWTPFSSVLPTRLWGGGWWGSGNCSLGYSPHGSRRGDCDIVMTLGVEMIWMVKGALTIKHLFCFLLGALSPAKNRGIFLDLHWLFSS